MCILEISPEIYKSKFNFLWEQSDITDLLQLVLQLPLGAARGSGRPPLDRNDLGDSLGGIGSSLILLHDLRDVVFAAGLGLSGRRLEPPGEPETKYIKTRKYFIRLPFNERSVQVLRGRHVASLSRPRAEDQATGEVPQPVHGRVRVHGEGQTFERTSV